MSPGLLWYLVWTALLAVLLFFPVANLVWVASVRRLERRWGRKLDDAELRGQKRRARVVSLLLVAIFAALFNYNVFGVPGSP